MLRVLTPLERTGKPIKNFIPEVILKTTGICGGIDGCCK